MKSTSLYLSNLIDLSVIIDVASSSARKENRRKQLNNRVKEKTLLANEFYGLVLGSPIFQRLVLLARRKKNHAACVLVVCCLTGIIKDQIVEDESIESVANYNFFSSISSCW